MLHLALILEKGWTQQRRKIHTSHNQKANSSSYGTKVSQKSKFNVNQRDISVITSVCIEIKKSKVTPAPSTYNQEVTKHAKPARFDDTHMGTDIKMTAKDIKLTPGPGDYTRIDDALLSRTFHSSTRAAHQMTPKK